MKNLEQRVKEWLDGQETDGVSTDSLVARFAALEIEACAKIAEGYAALHIESNPCHIQAKKTAAKIRARGGEIS